MQMNYLIIHFLDMKNNNNIALMIREAIISALKEQKISQRQCAIDCEFDYQNFNHFLKNKRPFPLEDIEKVLKYLKLEIIKDAK